MLNKACCPQQVAASPWYTALTLREQRVLAITLYERPEAILIDLSQSVGRCRPICRSTGPLCTHALLPGNHWFMLLPSAIRSLTGRECLTLQGFPWQQDVGNFLRERKDPFSDSLCADLAENAFGGNVVTSIVLAAFMSIPWCEPHPIASGAIASGSGNVVENDAVGSCQLSCDSSEESDSQQRAVLAHLGVL
eukprot:6469238-Amphidinium_carterae.2